MVAMTEQVVAECDGGTATTERVTALVQERAVHLRDCNPDIPPTAADRMLIERLVTLDEQLVRWCAETQRALEQRRSQIPTPASSSTTRLSDIA